LERTVTRAGLPDIPGLEKLVNSAYRGEGAKKGWTTEADLLDGIRIDTARLQEMIERDNAAILQVLGTDGNLEGCVYLEKKGEKMYLGMLTVAPGGQGRGTGKWLMREAEKYAFGQGCSRMTMSVISVRLELIAWYERHGYYKTGETQPFPTDIKFGIPRQPLEFLIMEKKITF